MDRKRKAEVELAGDFLASIRGRFIIAQALHYGIQELEKVKGVHKEVSNINDMHYLKDNLFNFHKELFIPHHDLEAILSPE